MRQHRRARVPSAPAVTRPAPPAVAPEPVGPVRGGPAPDLVTELLGGPAASGVPQRSGPAETPWWARDASAPPQSGPVSPASGRTPREAAGAPPTQGPGPAEQLSAGLSPATNLLAVTLPGPLANGLGRHFGPVTAGVGAAVNLNAALQAGGRGDDDASTDAVMDLLLAVPDLYAPFGLMHAAHDATAAVRGGPSLGQRLAHSGGDRLGVQQARRFRESLETPLVPRSSPDVEEAEVVDTTGVFSSGARERARGRANAAVLDPHAPARVVTGDAPSVGGEAPEVLRSPVAPGPLLPRR